MILKKRKYAAEKFYTRSICPKLYFNIPDCETCQHDESGDLDSIFEMQ